VVGHSWGGSVASRLAGRYARVSCVVLWGSIPDRPRNWTPDFREINGRQVAELWGNLIGSKFFEEFGSMARSQSARVAHGHETLATRHE
jgi:pimeloyl-ACP methyl ester carboxylesterase